MKTDLMARKDMRAPHVTRPHSLPIVVPSIIAFGATGLFAGSGEPHSSLPPVASHHSRLLPYE